MNTDTPSPAEVLYGNPSTGGSAAGAESSSPPPFPAAAAPTIEQCLYGPKGAAIESAQEEQATLDELIALEPQSLAESMYADQDAAEGTDYRNTLGRGFDALEQAASRENHEEDIAALAEGRVASAALLGEWRVQPATASEMVQTLAEWQQRQPLELEEIDANREETLIGLRAEWGRHYDANLRLAQQTAREACQRLPWLAALLADGAGNDPKLVKHFAQIGLRNARRRKG